MDARKETYPFTIGKKFKVNWDGRVDASDGYFEGTIYAEDGYFSGSIEASSIDGGTITGTSISAAEINGGTISGTEIITDKLFAGTVEGYSYEKWTRNKTSDKWSNSGEVYIFTSGSLGDPYYPNGNESTALVKYENRKSVGGSTAAHLGTFTGAIPAVNADGSYKEE
jgi:hypothetical protein